jgi:hypothetical protein
MKHSIITITLCIISAIGGYMIGYDAGRDSYRDQFVEEIRTELKDPHNTFRISETPIWLELVNEKRSYYKVTYDEETAKRLREIKQNNRERKYYKVEVE